MKLKMMVKGNQKSYKTFRHSGNKYRVATLSKLYRNHHFKSIEQY